MREISIENFQKKRKYQRNRYKFMPEDQEEKLRQHQKDYYT